MYEEFFRLQRRPFCATPDPSCAYLAGPLQTVLDELVVCLERGEGIAVLTAPAGYGKTLLCETVQRELGDGFATVLLRHGHFSSAADLLRILLAELGTTSANQSPADLRRDLISAVRERRQQGQLLVVICDEAHCLDQPVLEELRQLVDHADHGVCWVRLLLVGQMELEEKLAGPALSALNQRLRAHATLPALTAQEALDYIDYRITWAGGRTEEVFAPEALQAIVEAADGVPRRLNQLCDHVLLTAYAAEQRPATAELVTHALMDLQHLPLTWNIRGVRQQLDGFEPFSTRSECGASPSLGDESRIDAEPCAAAESADEEDSSETHDPLGEFFAAVEAELDGFAPEVQTCEEYACDAEIYEEPVIDRYAAIDAGWPPGEFPPAAMSQPARADRVASAAKPPVRVEIGASEPEARLHADVLELVAETQQALRSERSRPWAESSEEGYDVIETEPPPKRTPERSFRNLFTRLRRKQKGLE
jgi:type II secretory pathway predicted ATPase ExeA